ncbi:MAG: hypothetical protein PHW32_04310, partial [Bacilli bacterium]|nr:hypothetical protein [Bacilli bacterium]MDD4719175.1 hypothetical protein [Bacilli bacterium]
MKLNNKGFTVVELVLSFSVTTIVIVLLFQLVVSLKDLYNSSGFKTELFIKQATITEQINKELNNKTIISVDDCGTDCIVFNFTDGSSSELSVNREQVILNYSGYSTKLVKDSYFGDAEVEFYRNIENTTNNIDSFILINIPIYYDLYEDDNFGINIVYQYNSNEEYIIGEEF